MRSHCRPEFARHTPHAVERDACKRRKDFLLLLYCEMIAPIIADILVNLARIHIDAKIVVTPVNGERDEVSWKSIVAPTIGRGLFHQ